MELTAQAEQTTTNTVSPFENICIPLFYSEIIELMEKYGLDELVSPPNSPKCTQAISHSTFFKWKEEFQKRLPQKNTIEQIFSKIYKSDNPNHWTVEKYAELKKYINKNYISSFSNIIDNNLTNVSLEESYVISRLTCSNGASEKELIENIGILKYILKEENIENISSVNKLVVEIYKDYAVDVLNNLIKKNTIIKNGDRYLIKNERNNHISSTIHSANMSKLASLRTLVTNLNSPEDMFLGNNFSLTKESKLELMVFLVQLRKKQEDKLAKEESNEYNAKPTRIDINCWSLDFSDLLLKSEEELLQ